MVTPQMVTAILYIRREHNVTIIKLMSIHMLGMRQLYYILDLLVSTLYIFHSNSRKELWRVP